jgi:hypothetical protein
MLVRHATSGILHGYLIIVGVVGFLALLSAFPGMRIHAFEITGNNAVKSDIVARAIEDIIGRPSLFIVGTDVPVWAPQQSIAASIYALDPRIRDVSVSGRFSRTLKVEIIEESPAMLWCGSDVPTSTPASQSCWFASDRGEIYAEAPDYGGEAPYPIFYTTPAPIFNDPYPREHEYPVGYVIADPTTMDRLNTLSSALSERGYQVTHVGVTQDADVVVFTKEATRFLFSLSRNILEDMKRLEALEGAMQVRKDTSPFTQVDLRFERKVYYR